MNDESVNTGPKEIRGRFRKGTSGNPRGKPRGSRNKSTMLALALMEKDATTIAAKCIELALAGDGAALRLVIERLVPVRRELPIQFAMPPIKTAADLPRAVAAIVSGVSAGHLLLSEAERLASMVADFAKAIETAELEQRLAALEAGR